MKKKRSSKQIEAAAFEFSRRMEFLETAWSAKTEYEVDMSTGMCWFKITPVGAMTTLAVHDVPCWEVLLPAAS
jgi:hypothetical protein